MALSYKNDSEQDERLNPATSNDLRTQEQAGYDREFDSMVNNYSQSADAGQEDANIAKVKAGEETPQAPWTNSVSGYNGHETQKGRKLTTQNIRAIIKKRGIWGLLATIVLGGGAAGIIMTSPALLLVHMSEILTGKFNTQLSSLSTRNEKILNSKVNGSTKGFCSSVISINCRYTSLSDKQVERLKAAGIAVDSKGETLIRGRTKPTSYSFTDSTGKIVTVNPDEFMKTYSNNVEFRSAVKQAYNPKYAGFSDFIFKKVEDWLKISKRAPFKEGATDDERTKAVVDETKNGRSATEGKVAASDKNCKQNCVSQEQADAANKAVDEIGTEAEKVAKTGTKAGAVALENTASVVKVTGIADNACTVLGLVNSVGYGAKVIRAAQMARYAMIFLTAASMIKAGTAQPSDVSYLGNILTKTTKDNPKSATDSYGFQYAAGMQTGPIDEKASAYLAGGGLGGQFSGLSTALLTVLGVGDIKAARNTCHILKNPFVQGASLLAGVALMIIPGTQAIEASKIAGQIALAAVTTAATIILPSLLADIVAGVLVDNNTAGEAAGNAITAGASNMMSTTAAAGGNAPLTPDEAVAYQSDQATTLAQYAEEDRLAYSPLDATQPNTFMGQVVTKLLPYSSKVSSVTGLITSPFQMLGSSLGSLLPTTKAASASEYTQCNDYDYRSINLATDPFCNPIRGIPAKYLQDDPVTINNRLFASGDIDNLTGNPVAGSHYANFVTDCINRQTPLGTTDENFDSPDGSECFIDSQQKADYYVHYIDQRALTGQEGGYDAPDPNAGAVTASSTTSTGSNSSLVKGDDYPYKNGPIDIPSPLGYLTRECVDFVTWRLNEQSGTTKEPFNQKFMGFGNAVNWRDRATAAGFKVDQTPKLGSVAWWGAGVWAGGFGAGDPGHVAIVSGVNSDGSIVIEQYNVAIPGKANYHEYSSVTISASDVKNLLFIHMADIGA